MSEYMLVLALCLGYWSCHTQL